MLRLMCVTAHPDDEAGNFGGSLRLYAERGVETCVVCLTPGQAASHRGGAKNDQELAAIRRKEFAAACAILKVSRSVVLDYPDGQLHRADLYHIACDLTLHIRHFRPHVLITYGAEGGVTGHTDHAMAGVFATMAFQAAGRSNRFPEQLGDAIKPHRAQKLYYETADFTIPGRPPIALAPYTAIIDVAKYVDAKLAAFREHQTQAPLWSLFEEHVKKRAARELFHLAAAVKMGPAEKETDLFAGVEENAELSEFS